MFEELVILPAILGIIIVGIDITRKKKDPFDYLSLINLTFFTGFVAGPILLYSCNAMSLSHGWETSVALYRNNFTFAQLFTLIGYLSLLSGYFCGHRHHEQAAVKVPNTRYLFVAGTFLLFIGAAAYYQYAGLYGGIQYLVMYSDGIRAEWFTTDSPLVFLRHFGGFCAISTFIYLGLMRNPPVKKSILAALFILSLFISLFVFWTWAGRLTIITFVATLYLSIVLFRGRWLYTDKLILITFSLFIITLGDYLFKYFLNTDGMSSATLTIFNLKPILQLFGSELAFPTLSLSAAISLFGSEIPPRWILGDWLIGFSHLLPGRLLAIQPPETLSELNTLIGFPDTTGTVPVDILSFSYYSLGFPGIILWPFLFGFFVRRLESFILKYKNSDTFIVFYTAIGAALGSYILYGDPDHFLQGGFHLIVGLLLVINSLKLVKRQ